MKRIYIAAVIIWIYALNWAPVSQAIQFPTPNGVSLSADSPAGRAFKNKTSNVQIEGEGTVNRILTDDLDGTRHQRFILRLASGQTLLVAHNIDVAPRVAGLQIGDNVRFYGEYVWNDKGGIIHWTHHDPRGRHPGGWIKHNGQIYQ